MQARGNSYRTILQIIPESSFLYEPMHAAEIADPASDNIGRDHTLAPIDLGQ
jgi:hypothetical protein